MGKRDELRGLKENVIVGRLIPPEPVSPTTGCAAASRRPPTCWACRKRHRSLRSWKCRDRSPAASKLLDTKSVDSYNRQSFLGLSPFRSSKARGQGQASRRRRHSNKCRRVF